MGSLAKRRRSLSPSDQEKTKNKTKNKTKEKKLFNDTCVHVCLTRLTSSRCGAGYPNASARTRIQMHVLCVCVFGGQRLYFSFLVDHSLRQLPEISPNCDQGEVFTLEMPSCAPILWNRTRRIENFPTQSDFYHRGNSPESIHHHQGGNRRELQKTYGEAASHMFVTLLLAGISHCRLL